MSAAAVRTDKSYASDYPLLMTDSPLLRPTSPPRALEILGQVSALTGTSGAKHLPRASSLVNMVKAHSKDEMTPAQMKTVYPRRNSATSLGYFALPLPKTEEFRMRDSIVANLKPLLGRIAFLARKLDFVDPHLKAYDLPLSSSEDFSSFVATTSAGETLKSAMLQLENKKPDL